MTLHDAAASPVSTDVDFDKEGLQTGTLRVPHSSDRDAYGHVPIPLMVARRGDGPTVLLTGANHGDEYEGPVALMRLMRSLRMDELRGRLIIVPALNMPAYLNGTRTSPLDGGNLNRLFPGNPAGTPTQVIAHYIASTLVPMADYLIDLHAGGNTMEYLPMLMVNRAATAEAKERLEWFIRAFNAPRVMFLESLESDLMIGASARRNNVFFATGEFGGNGCVSLEGLAVAERGVAGVLRALGMQAGGDVPGTVVPRRYTFSADHLVYAPVPGIFAPAYRLGDDIAAGQLAGSIYDPHRPWAEPVQVHFKVGGVAMMVRTSARVEAGNCLGHLATEVAA